MRNRWKLVLVGRLSVKIFSILALSKMVAEKKSNVTMTLIRHRDWSLVGLILFLGFKKS